MVQGYKARGMNREVRNFFVYRIRELEFAFIIFRRAALTPQETNSATGTQESIATTTKAADAPAITKTTTSSPAILAPKKIEVTKKPEKIGEEEAVNSTTSPNTAIGTFILEDPANPE